ncbi:MAG TPA: NADH-quinone oxidoreductase subunit NuoE [Myxococcales bacterium]|jgi:NADH-quinone oxidoreductase subunit E
MFSPSPTAGPQHSPPPGKLASVFANFPDAKREYLIPLLQAVQESEGFLSRESIVAIAQHLKLPASKVYGVATFYNQFRFQAQGRFHVQVCRGTACHVKGSANVQNALQRALKVQAGQTTRDGLFSLEVVACIGACGLAPVITVAGEFHAGVAPEKVTGILNPYRRKAAT